MVRKCNLYLRDYHYSYPLDTWLEVCKDKTPTTVSFKEIDIPYYNSTLRLYECDISYPGIVYKTEPKFKMIDGNHRLWKQILSAKESGMFYILDDNDLSKLSKDKDSLGI
tara:strand:+ start:1906 stop:2235 length:330 start_codon:yes stop_codon:yes gene_type:complete